MSDDNEGKTMDTFLDTLLSTTRIAESEFKPVARYFVSMDSLIYINQDLSYRADRVDGRLTLLWHPYEETLIGIKLKGFKFMFETLRSISELNIEKKDFIPLVKCLELALFGVGEALLNNASQEAKDARKENIIRKYQAAKVFVDETGIYANDVESRLSEAA